MKIGDRAITCAIAFLLFLPATPAPLAQEIKTSVDAPPGAPSFTFRKRRVRDDADTRLQAILQRIRPTSATRESRANRGRRARPPSASGFCRTGGSRTRIKKTSGNAHLDDATLEAVRKAAPLPYLGKTLVLTIRYTLTRATD